MASSGGPLHILLKESPWGQKWPRPRDQVFTLKYIGKLLKIFFSKTTGPRAFIYGIWQHLEVLYKYSWKNLPGVKNGPAPGVKSFTLKYIGKLLKIFFSKTTRPRAFIFCIWQHLEVLYIYCWKNPPGVKNGPAPWVKSFYVEIYREPLKIFFIEATRPRALEFGIWQHLEVLYEVCSKLPPGVKNGPALCHMVNIDLDYENLKKIFLSKTSKSRALMFGM